MAGASEEVNAALTAAHDAVSAVDANAANALYAALSQLAAQVARTQMENRALGQAFRAIKVRAACG